MYKSVELFYEPLEALRQLSDDRRAEMSMEQLAFLCGMIKACKPGKIVEIGVAAGATTAVIMNCVSMLGLGTRMFSIDLSAAYYRDGTKETGYLAKEWKSMSRRQCDHTFYTGKYAAECMEEIGKDVDFVILDTVHSLPGELLDFLVCFPFLKQGAVVVLHDILLNHSGDNADAFATKLLFDSVVGTKFMNREGEDKRMVNAINIAAFTITEDTKRYIDDVFSALTITWKYLPCDKELNMYRDFLERYYAPSQTGWFDLAVRLNRETVKKRSEGFVRICKWITSIRAKKIYVYGCGTYGRFFYHLFEQCGMDLGGYIISDGQAKSEDLSKVSYLSEVSLQQGDRILIGVKASLQKEICGILQEKGIRDYILPDEEQVLRPAGAFL